MPNVTLSNLWSRVWSRLDNNTQLYETAALTYAINESIRITNIFIGYIQTTGTLITRPNQVWYPMPDGVLIPMKLQFEGSFIERVSLNYLGETFPNWRADTTANTGYAVSHWMTSGLDKFVIHPADSIGGNLISITGVAEPTVLVNASDTISFPEEYSEVIEDLAFTALIMKEGGKIMADGMAVYKQAISKLKEFSRWQAMRQPVQSVQMVQRR